MQARKVDLFRDGPGQAVRIPKEFELPGTEATIRREGDQLVIKPLKQNSLLEYLSTKEPLDEDFPEVVDSPAEPVEL